MKTIKALLAANGKYKSVINLRDDGLYEIDWQYLSAEGQWISPFISSSSQHLTDTLENAIKIGEEQILTTPEEELDSMTVNERLAIKGLHNEFSKSINSKNKQRAIAILIEVRLTEKQATETIDAIFNNPKYYGF